VHEVTVGLDGEAELARADAARRMDELRAQLPDAATKQVVKWVREDRERAAGAVAPLTGFR